LLVGRSDASERAAALADVRVAALAGAVAYEAIDVCDAGALRAAVAREEARGGRMLDGVFHLAGLRSWRPIAEETEEHLRATLAPKVAGTMAIEALLADRPAARIVAFSSVAGHTGAFAEAGYCAANRYLEHRLEARRRAGAAAVTSIVWS